MRGKGMILTVDNSWVATPRYRRLREKTTQGDQATRRVKVAIKVKGFWKGRTRSHVVWKWRWEDGCCEFLCSRCRDIATPGREA
jgi:hypothetical protein